MTDLVSPKHGDRGPCANCGAEIVVAAIHTSNITGWSWPSCRHTGTGLYECNPEAWDAVTDAADYHGGFATWVGTP